MFKNMILLLVGATVVAPAYAEGIYHDSWIDLNKNGIMDIYEDRSEPVDRRVDDLLSLMTVDEKTVQLATLYGYKRVLKDALPTEKWKESLWKDGIANIDEQHNGIKDSDYLWPASRHTKAINDTQRWFIENTRLGIPVDFTNEGIRGICHVYATNFPSQIAVGASWDKQLANEIGMVTGVEAAALGYTHIYSPILDVPRDQRWGRVVECYGESPYLVAQLGIQQARGIRSAGPGVTCKHYAVYSVPNGGRDGEARTDPQVSPREMELIHLYAFEQVIANADVTGVMSSYNDWNGEPVSGSKKFLTDILRDRMGFNGYVVSDSDAVKQINYKHKVAESYKDAARMFIEAGGNVRTNFSMPEQFVNPIRECIADGSLSMAVVDDRVRDVLAVKFRLGLFDNPYVDSSIADKLVYRPEHRQTALKAAREALVLLKNKDSSLPLNKSGLSKIAVVGPNARETAALRSRYGPKKGNIINVYDGIKAFCGNDIELVYSKGCDHYDSNWPLNEIVYTEPSEKQLAMVNEAVKAAQDSDCIIAVVGENEHMVGEGRSRTSLDLPQIQQLLVRKLCATGKPVIIVLVNGRPMSINWEDMNCPAIIDAWFGGEFMGLAVAEALFGEYNPGGKLPITFPRTAGQIPVNFPVRPRALGKQSSGDNPNGTGYSRVTECLYPFGYGLSYTTFKYSDMKLNSSEINADEELVVNVTVTNSGQYEGDEIVQLYVNDKYSSVITYEKVLRGFERVHLIPGESKTVTFSLHPIKDFWMIDTEDQRVVEPGDFEIMVAASSEDIRDKKTVKVVGEKYIISSYFLQ